MNKLSKIGSCVPTMSDKDIAIAIAAEERAKELPPLPCVTQHTLHSGIYSRTMFMPKGSVAVGVIIQIPTTVIISGKVALYIGEEVIHIDGYNVIPALGNRKQVAYAIEDSYATLVFKTEATTVEEAEQEMTIEYNRLLSRDSKSINITNITGV